jgi:sigma54-dependent transcription regulator
MADVVEVDVSRLGRFTAESVQWLDVCAVRPNLLLEGPEAATFSVLLALEPHVRRPIVWKPNQARLDLPAANVGALVLPNVGRLDATEQARLLAWLEDPDLRAQVVSTSEHPLFSQVARREFDETLYYRLNVVLLHIDRRRKNREPLES